MLPDTYGCAVANRYGDLLDDDADPFELINQVVMEKIKKKQDKEKKDKQKKAGQKESQKDRRVAYVSEVQDPAPGQRTTWTALPRPHNIQTFCLLLVFLHWTSQPKGASLVKLCQLLIFQRRPSGFSPDIRRKVAQC